MVSEFQRTGFRGQISEDSGLRGQKTDELAALSRRGRWKNRALGFASPARRDAPQADLSSVLCLLSSVLCPLKPDKAGAMVEIPSNFGREDHRTAKQRRGT
ncbi:MAG: hypothetical protein LBD06_11760 [Candidatus Accumulibacter sp.]|nr:hypothetical protein [Accumulibacter sp.]